MAELIESQTRKKILVDIGQYLNLLCEKLNLLSEQEIVPSLEAFLKMAIELAGSNDLTRAMGLRAKLIDLLDKTDIAIISEIHEVLTIISLEIMAVYNATNTRSPSGMAMYAYGGILNDNTLVLIPIKYIPEY